MNRPLQVEVVAIQSQVVYGSVGNTAAVPVLQAGGLLVAQVPSIILSSTPGYPSVHGGPVPRDWFAGWLDDLLVNRALDSVRAVQIGYLGEPWQAGVLKDWLEKVLKLAPSALVAVDPVLGDHDTGIYTAPGMVDAWRALLPSASVLTPNSFELGVLSGMPVGTAGQVVTAARSLLAGRTERVVVTSAAHTEWTEGRMRIMLVDRDSVEVIEHDKLDSAVKGTGDMFTAGITRGLLEDLDPRTAAEQAAERVAVALRDSIKAGSEELVLRRP